MKTKAGYISFGIMLMVFLTGITPSVAPAAEPLRFSCSAQVYEAFGQEGLDRFTRQTGIPVEVTVGSSTAATNRLMNEYSDLAASARRLFHRHRDYGYEEIVFAKDPLVVFANAAVAIDSLSVRQIRDIFSGAVTNWRDVGGEDRTIVVIIPGQRTGAYQNFTTLFMGGREIHYDFMSYKSTMVVEAVRHYPYVISFISRAAVYGRPTIKTLKVDGVSPEDPKYPYFQVFSFITKGRPQGAVKAFIDFAVDGPGRDILQQKGMIMVAE